MTEIGEPAFYHCSSLTTVYYPADKLIEGDYYTFAKNAYERATLYLSKKGMETYLNVEPWNKFRNVVEYDFPAGVDDVVADFDENAPYEVYNLNGVLVGTDINSLPAAIYIVRQGTTVKKIAVK